jgi:hypothetical protein
MATMDGKLPVKEPVWIRPDDLQKAQRAPFLCRVEPNKRDDFVPLYTTPPAAYDRAIELLRRCENEMRYAGWGKLEADNTARNGVYEQVKQFLEKNNGN